MGKYPDKVPDKIIDLGAGVLVQCTAVNRDQGDMIDNERLHPELIMHAGAGVGTGGEAGHRNADRHLDG